MRGLIFAIEEVRAYAEAQIARDLIAKGVPFEPLLTIYAPFGDDSTNM